MEFQKQFLQFVEKISHEVAEVEGLDEEASFEDEMPQIQREVWSDDEGKDMPVLQRMDGLSPPPLSLITNDGKEKELCVQLKGQIKGNKKSEPKNKLPCSVVFNAQLTVDSEKVSDMNLFKNSIQSCVNSAVLPLVGQPLLESSETKLSLKKVICGSDEKSDIGFELDSLMEPDSTSEFLHGVTRLLKDSEACNRIGICPCSEVSPRSTAFAGLSTPGSNSGLVNSGEVSVRSEEGQAECDSTSIFLTSPSAISPASQGEIEERVCSVLTDHEDGASPAQNFCSLHLCHYQTPLPDLVSRSHHNVLSPVPHYASKDSAKDNQMICSKSLTEWKPLVRTLSQREPVCTHMVCESKLGLPKSASSFQEKEAHVVERKPVDLEESSKHIKTFVENTVPPVLDFGSGTADIQHNVRKKSNNESLKATEHIKVSDFKVQSADSDNSLSKNIHCFSSKDSNENLNHNSSVKNFSGKIVSTKKQQSNVLCDFPHIASINWKLAVAETVESPISLSSQDGENKPGIILKIRTKSLIPKASDAQMIGYTSEVLASSAQVPQAENMELVLPCTFSETAGKIDRKRHTVDCPEILSRLRKREKIPKVEQQMEPVQEKLSSQQSKGSNCKQKTSHKKRDRRNFVLKADLSCSVDHLSILDQEFALASIRLYQLQKLTHDLLSSLSESLESRLSNVMPDSSTFSDIIDDTIIALECSDLELENFSLDLEGVCATLKSLKLEHTKTLPKIILCRSPQHTLEEFQDKLCRLLQLLLPDISISFSESLGKGGTEDLVAVLNRILQANKQQGKSGQSC